MKYAGMGQELIILGAGGHAKVLLATAIAAGWSCISLYDDDNSKHGHSLFGITIKGPLPPGELIQNSWTVIGIGFNELREKVSQRYPSVRWATLVHPSAVLHDTVQLGAGSVVLAGCVIQPDSIIGRHCIINTSASVDHDCKIGDFVHMAPGSTLAGGVNLGRSVFVGIGALVIPGIQIGDHTTIGAGACVVNNLPPNITAVGLPAREIKSSLRL